MSTFAAGQRVKVTENYAINVGAEPFIGFIEDIGAEGTVVSISQFFIEVALDSGPVLSNTNHLFFEDELEPV